MTYGVYFAAWIKSEVGPSKRVFAKNDEKIIACIENRGTLQSMLVEIVRDCIGFESFEKDFLVHNINGTGSFLKGKGVKNSDDLGLLLDDIETR